MAASDVQLPQPQPGPGPGPGSCPPQQDEWTQVRRKPRRKAAAGKSQQQQRKTPAPPSHQPPGAGAAPAVIMMRADSTAHLSASDIQRDYDRFEKSQWQGSSCQRRLKDLILQQLQASSSNPPPRVNQAVCLGIGSFDPEDGAWEVKRRAHIQLAAFLSIIADLQQHQQDPDHDHDQQESSERPPLAIRCFFQEPLFTPADKEFVKGLGHEVVDSPAGFAKVDRETLVFGVHLYRDIYNQAISKCVPAVFIGTGLDIWEGYHGSGGLDWVKMEELDRQCDRVPFPEDEGFTTFSSTSIHWRNT
ncbi:hypothetical protein SLS62_009379 [Diatrype stigma]|uniref:SRR1-like domain-containing protein n=1 Tax=Diatrype stigma TaxID=117547 RepID=A0AAN9YKW7_9PEZI